MPKRLSNKLFLQTRQDVHEFNAGSRIFPQEPKPISDRIVQLITERAVGIRRPESFGSANEMDAIGYETLLPALVQTEIPEKQPRVLIGGPQCLQPYEASLLNCSALSFGPMSKNFILSLNKAARLGGFFQNTGEAGLSPYHFGVNADVEDSDFNLDSFFNILAKGGYKELRGAGDVVWQLGNGYFGCRNIDGSFNPEQFQLKASPRNVKMIEVKLSQGVEPRKEMPVKQVTPGIAKVMGITWGGQARLQHEHSSFASPVELLKFIRRLRELSGGKPIGLKIGVSHRHYFLAICKAMLKTGILLDFITVDGMEAGTAAATSGAAGFTGTSLDDAVLFVHNALVGTNLRRFIRIIASGKVFTEKDMFSKLARGADLCATARGFMISVGCDQQRTCYAGNCMRGIATQDPELIKYFNIRQNTQRIYSYHKITIQEFKELLSIAGVSHPARIGPFHLQKRISATEVKTLDDVYDFIRPGALLSSLPWLVPAQYRKYWQMAKPDTPFAEMLEPQIRAIFRQ